MRQKVLAIAGAFVLPGILLSLLWLINPVAAVQTNVTVCAGGGCTYETISDAVTAVPDETIIEIQAGTYTETVVVNRSLTLEGADAATTIVDGNRGEQFSRLILASLSPSKI